MENQIDNFEAEAEGFSGKKGKTKNPRLVCVEKVSQEDAMSIKNHYNYIA